MDTSSTMVLDGGRSDQKQYRLSRRYRSLPMPAFFPLGYILVSRFSVMESEPGHKGFLSSITSKRCYLDGCYYNSLTMWSAISGILPNGPISRTESCHNAFCWHGTFHSLHHSILSHGQNSCPTCVRFIFLLLLAGRDRDTHGDRTLLEAVWKRCI